MQKIAEFRSLCCRIRNLPPEKTRTLDWWLRGPSWTFLSFCQNGIYLVQFTCRICTRALFNSCPGTLMLINKAIWSTCCTSIKAAYCLIQMQNTYKLRTCPPHITTGIYFLRQWHPCTSGSKTIAQLLKQPKCKSTSFQSIVSSHFGSHSAEHSTCGHGWCTDTFWEEQ